MVPTKKPSTSTGNPTSNPIPSSVVRTAIPSLSPIPGEKPATQTSEPATPAAGAASPEKATPLASADLQPTAAPAAPAKPTETLGPKLRAKGEIITALRAGAHVLHTEVGLYRIVAANGSLNPASKRRILALIQQGILKANGEGNGRIYVLDAEAEKKAAEKKPAAKPEAPATAPAVKDAK